MSLAKRGASAAAKAVVAGDTRLDVPAGVRRRLWRASGVDTSLAGRLKKQWPMSQQPERQQLVVTMAKRQQNRATFDNDYYHYTYEQYLGNAMMFKDAYPLLQRRCIHWTDVLLCEDAPPPAQLRGYLQQAGVDPLASRDTEDLHAWVVGLALRAASGSAHARASWPDVHAELNNIVATLPPGRLSECHSLTLAALVSGCEVAQAFDMIASMKQSATVFTERSYQLLTAPTAARYDIVNGGEVLPAAAAGYQGLVRSAAKARAKEETDSSEGGATHAAAVHAVFLHYLRRGKRRAFWWAVREYERCMADLGPLTPESLQLLFAAWMPQSTGRRAPTLHAATTIALTSIFTRHGLLRQAAAIYGDAPTPIPADRATALASAASSVKAASAERDALCTALVTASPDGDGRNAAVPAPEHLDAAALATVCRAQQKPASRRKAHKIPTEQVEAACVRELLRNAPFGGDRMVHKYITVSNM